MSKLMKLMLALALVGAVALLAQAGINNRFSDIELGDAGNTRNIIRIPEIAAPTTNPITNWGWLYVKDDSSTSGLYFEADDGTVTDILAAGTVNYSDIGDPTADTAIAFADNEINAWTLADTNEDMFTVEATGAFGDVSVMVVKSSTGDPTDGTVLEVVSHDANTDPLVVSTSGQAGVLIVNQDGTMSVIGDTDITGDFSLTGSFYQTAIASASSGNVNLTIDAAGTGTITIGNTSTGLVAIPNDNIDMFGSSVDIGNASTDTLTITSIIDSDVTLDDGSGASPSLIFIDVTNETATFSKVDGSHLTFTPNAGTQAFQILTGNLRVGNGSPGTAAMNGEDTYLEGELEVDGAVTLDGAVAANGIVTHTENIILTAGADEYFQIDADTTANTGTAGVIDLNVQSATNTHKAMSITYQLEDSATAAYGIYVDINDDATGGETFSALYVINSAGTASTTIAVDVANTVDTGFNMVNAAAAKSIAIDASSTISTQTAGLIDISAIMSEDTAAVINIDVESEANGAGEFVHGIYINLDDDADNGDNELTGLTITTDGGAGTGLTQGINILGANMDAAIWVETGYVRIGTGDSPGITPGDDDLFVEGTVEVNGNFYPDGAIIGDGATVISGVLSDSEDVADSANVIGAGECGKMFFLNDATEAATTLPALSAVSAGCWFEFYTTLAPSGASYTIVTGNTHENKLYGSVVEAETDTGDDGPVAQAQDTITLVDGQFLIGDVIRIVSDGTNWFVNGQVQKDGAVTFGTT